MKILVTGATGLIGRRLIHKLMLDGHEVRALARSPDKLPELPVENIFKWSDDQVVPSLAMAGCHAVIHLAGEGIADQRWTSARKKRLWDSRVVGTKNLVLGLKALKADERPQLLISSSAIGYYGQTSEAQAENTRKGRGFLADLCDEWEKTARRAESFGLKTVILRTGLVLAKEGGVLKKSGPAVLGSGEQFMSWIHIDDIIRFITYTLTHDSVKSGPYNLTAPQPVTNLEFTKKFAKVHKFPFTVTVPKIALKMVLGEMATVVLANQNIIPQNVLSTGFKFRFENLDAALQDLAPSKSRLDNFFSSKQFIPLKRSEVFPFFGKAENLEILTPPWLNFHIQSKSTDEVGKNTLIEYKLNIHGVPVKWKTLISGWSPEDFFIDEQLSGPYKKWHHVHKFEEVPGGTLISDEVTYQIPGWFLGKLLLPLIRRDVETIFQFRQKKIKELFR